ncbi:MAG TPA: CotH kinase family protein [Methylomirabilota bacterium]|nr:CotH kinase family protein [Methylomirabilota bacterium]
MISPLPLANTWRPRRRAATALALALAGAVPLGADTVILSEVMPANTRTWRDRDRAYSDWIELFNPGAAAVNLGGWYLTDSPEALTRWRFPAVTLPPQGFLVVFASGKNRALPEGELHTNFKLKAGGDFLALVRPDGRTIASQFTPAYPALQPDTSYGIDMSDEVLDLVAANSPVRLLVPDAAPATNWTHPSFDDTKWEVGRQALGFTGTTNALAPLRTDLRARMAGRRTAVLLRYPFEVTGAGLDKLTFTARTRDGFVAWLNGVEIVRRNAPAGAGWNSTAAAAAGGDPAPIFREDFETTSAAYALDQPDPAARPKVSAPNAGSAGQFLRLVNGREADQVNSVSFPRLVTGPFAAMTAEFDFRCRSGDGEGDAICFFVLPTDRYGADGVGLRLNALQTARDGNFPGVLAIRLRLYPASEPTYVAVHWDGRRHVHAPFSASGLPERVFHRASIRLRPGQGGMFVTVSFRSHTGSGSSADQVAIENAFIQGLNPFEARVQIAARVGGAARTVDLDNIHIQFTPAEGHGGDVIALAPALVRPGRNVLAVLALNNTVGDPEFDFAATLTGRRTSYDPRALRYFARPTPGKANSAGVAAVSKPPVPSIEGGVFTNTLAVELRARSPDTEIRYTLDGSEPREHSALYAGPIPIDRSLVLRCRAFTRGLLPSPVVTHNYTLLDESLTGFTSNLPLVILNPSGQFISRNRKTPVSARVIDAAGGRSSLLGPADFDGRGDANLRGFSSLRFPKRSYTFRVRDETGDKEDVSLLGLPKESDWILYAPYSDKTLLRDALAYELSNRMGRYAPRTRFVELFVQSGGGRLSRRDYAGVYVLAERITRNKKRVNIQELTAADNAEPAITGGYILKRDHFDDERPSFVTGRGVPWFLVEPEDDEITPQQRQWLARHLNEFERALYGSDFRDPARGYQRYLDVDAFIDQHWLIEMSKNIDGFRYSAYIHKDRNGRIVPGPAWDWNLSFGNADYHDGFEPTGWYTDLLRENELCWFRRLREDPDFVQRATDRWAALRAGVFHPDTICRRVDELAAQLQEAQRRNFQRWPILGRHVNPNYYVGRTYEDEVKWMKDWIRARIAWIDGQFLPRPAASRQGSRITLHAPRGAIHYTLDGTDPRASGGSVSRTAMSYGAAVSLPAGATLVARALDGRRWSAPLVVK